MSGLMQSLWPSGRGILVCCIMSWYFVVLGFNKRALFLKSVWDCFYGDDNPVSVFLYW